MRFLARGTLGFLSWLAVLWTIYSEQNHLLLYLGDPEIAFGTGEYLDIAVTAILLVYALYQVFHFIGATNRFDHVVAAHPALDGLVLVLLVALGWGIYRDVTHFRHLFLGGEPFGDDVDELAAVFLALGLLKTGNHGLHALRALAHLTRR